MKTVGGFARLSLRAYFITREINFMVMTDTAALKRSARTAGWIYLAMAITAFIALAYMPKQIYVKGNAASTFANILAKEQLLRWSVLSQLASQVLFIFLVLQLHQLFSSVDKRWSRAMVVLVVVQVPLVFMIELFSLSSLMVAKGEWMPSLSQTQQVELTMMMVRLRSQAIGFVEVFWGAWLIPFGMLVIRSVMIPRVIGLMLIIGGLAYLVEFTAWLIDMDVYPQLVTITSKLYAIAEIGTILWLLIAGVNRNNQQKTIYAQA